MAWTKSQSEYKKTWIVSHETVKSQGIFNFLMSGNPVPAGGVSAIDCK